MACLLGIQNEIQAVCQDIILDRKLLDIFVPFW